MTIENYAKALREGRIIHLTGGVNADMHDSLRKQYAEFVRNHPEGELIVTLNTSGGSTRFGSAIYSDLVAMQTDRKVWLVCQGEAGSWGTYLMLAVPKSRRVAVPMTMFFFHLGKFTWKMEISEKPATHEYAVGEYMTEIAQWKVEQVMLIKLLANRTDLSKADANELVSTPTYVTAKKAAKIGLIGHVLKGEIND